jgi:hypothetical protein
MVIISMHSRHDSIILLGTRIATAECPSLPQNGPLVSLYKFFRLWYSSAGRGVRRKMGLPVPYSVDLQLPECDAGLAFEPQDNHLCK